MKDWFFKSRGGEGGGCRRGMLIKGGEQGKGASVGQATFGGVKVGRDRGGGRTGEGRLVGQTIPLGIKWAGQNSAVGCTGHPRPLL
eukprot:183134-Chlamydomonas_euryale.AAC.3